MYNYEQEKQFVFTDEGQRKFLSIRDHVNKLLKESGAFSMGKATSKESGNSWSLMACIDRLLELGEIKEIPRGDVCAQYRIFVKPRE